MPNRSLYRLHPLQPPSGYETENKNAEEVYISFIDQAN
jgi:hypothetical protein